MKTERVDNWLGGKIIEGLSIKDIIENYDVFSSYSIFNKGVREHIINNIINYEGNVPLDIIEKEAFKKWYEDANWYGYDSEAKAMEQLNKRGDFKEEVLPTEFCGWFGNIEVMIEEAV